MQQAEYKNAFLPHSSETRIVLVIIFCSSWEYLSTTKKKKNLTLRRAETEKVENMELFPTPFCLLDFILITLKTE